MLYAANERISSPCRPWRDSVPLIWFYPDLPPGLTRRMPLRPSGSVVASFYAPHLPGQFQHVRLFSVFFAFGANRLRRAKHG
jgi:hypothetical protein